MTTKIAHRVLRERHQGDRRFLRFLRNLPTTYYEQEVDKSKFHNLQSFLNFNKKLPGLIFKDEHKGHGIMEFIGLRPKMYCLIDEKDVIHNAAKGVPRNVMIDGKINKCEEHRTIQTCIGSN